MYPVDPPVVHFEDGEGHVFISDGRLFVLARDPAQLIHDIPAQGVVVPLGEFPAEQLAQLANFLAIQRVQRQKRKIARLSRAAHDGAPLIQKRVAQGLHYSLVLLARVGRAGERRRDLR